MTSNEKEDENSSKLALQNRVVDLSSWAPKDTPSCFPVEGMDCPSRADVNYRYVMPVVEKSVRDMSSGLTAGKNRFLSHLESVMETHTDGKEAADETKRFKIGKFVILGFCSRDYVATVIKWLKGHRYKDEEIKSIMLVFDFSPKSAADLLSDEETRGIFESNRNIFVFDADAQGDIEGMVKVATATGLGDAADVGTLTTIEKGIQNDKGLCVAHLVSHTWPMIYRWRQLQTALTFFAQGGFDVLGIDISESWDGVVRKLDAGAGQVFQPWISTFANPETLVYKKANNNYCPDFCGSETNEDNVVLGLLTRKSSEAFPCILERGYGYRWIKNRGSKSADAKNDKNKDFAFAQKYYERMISTEDMINELREHKCYLTEKLLSPTYFGAMNTFVFAPHPSANRNLAVFSNVFAAAVCEEVIKPMLDLLKGHPLFRGLAQIIFYAVLPFGKDATYARLLKADGKLGSLSTVDDWVLLNEFCLTQSDFANAEYMKDSLLGDPARVFFSIPKQDRLNSCDFQIFEHEEAYSEDWRKCCFAGEVDAVPKGKQVFISAVPLYSGSFPFAAIGFAVPNAAFDAVPSASADGAAARRAVMTEGFRALISKSGRMKSFFLKVFNDYLAERDTSDDVGDSNKKIRAECDAYLRNVRNKDWHLADFGFGTTSLVKGKTVQNEDERMGKFWRDALEEALDIPIGISLAFDKLDSVQYFSAIQKDNLSLGHAVASRIHATRARKLLEKAEKDSNKWNELLQDKKLWTGWLASFEYSENGSTRKDSFVKWMLRMLISIANGHPINCEHIPCKREPADGDKVDDSCIVSLSDIDYLKLKGVFCPAGNSKSPRDIRFSLWGLLGVLDAFGVQVGEDYNKLIKTDDHSAEYLINAKEVKWIAIENSQRNPLIRFFSLLLPRFGVDKTAKINISFIEKDSCLDFRIVIDGTVAMANGGAFWSSLCSWITTHANISGDIDLLKTLKKCVKIEISFRTTVISKYDDGMGCNRPLAPNEGNSTWMAIKNDKNFELTITEKS